MSRLSRGRQRLRIELQGREGIEPAVAKMQLVK
jgi:DNA-directed RNA polymerase specialized sigma24 family protein